MKRTFQPSNLKRKRSPRFPRPHGYRQRSQSSGRSSCQGSCPPGRSNAYQHTFSPGVTSVNSRTLQTRFRRACPGRFSANYASACPHSSNTPVLVSSLPKGAPACRLAQPCQTSGSGKFSPQSSQSARYRHRRDRQGWREGDGQRSAVQVTGKLWRTLSRRCNG